MRKSLLTVLLVLLLAATAYAEEPFGAKRNYISFALGGYAPSGDLSDEGYKSGGDFTLIISHRPSRW